MVVFTARNDKWWFIRDIASQMVVVIVVLHLESEWKEIKAM